MSDMADKFPQKETNGIERQDVRLTVLGFGDEEEPINLALIGNHLKTMFAYWIVLAVGLGILAGVTGGGIQQFLSQKEIRTLVGISQDGGEAEYDIMKVKSPSVVENALYNLGLDVKAADRVRNAIHVSSVIPDNVQDQLSMYYNLLSQGGSGGSSVVQSLIETRYHVDNYIISIDYDAANMSKETGISFMTSLLRSYQDYFAETYNLNSSVGNPLNAVDYRDYDYAEAVNVFSNTLDNAIVYLNSITGRNVAEFRSVETGFTFQDLRHTAQILQDVDLDWVSSYIVIHSVSSYEAEMEISYYEWLIEELERQRAVERTRFSSLTNSIEDYEKNPILIAVQDGNSVVANVEDVNANYDAMITEKLNTQSRIATYNRSISYYQNVIERFQSGGTASTEDIQKVERYLEDLNIKLNALLNNISRTANEYYDKVAFSNRIRVLIPPTTKEASLISKVSILSAFGTAGLVFCIYFGLAIVDGLKVHNKQSECIEDNMAHDGRKSGDSDTEQ